MFSITVIFMVFSPVFLVQSAAPSTAPAQPENVWTGPGPRQAPGTAPALGQPQPVRPRRQRSTGPGPNPGVGVPGSEPGGPNRDWDSAAPGTITYLNLSVGIADPLGIKFNLAVTPAQRMGGGQYGLRFLHGIPPFRLVPLPFALPPFNAARAERRPFSPSGDF